MPVSYMEIDLRAFRHNLRVIRSHLKNVPAPAPANSALAVNKK